MGGVQSEELFAQGTLTQGTQASNISELQYALVL